MATFHYKGTWGEPLNGVKCDACGFKLYTNTTGFAFGEHMKTAKSQGWLITKTAKGWLNLCPECAEAMREKRRTEWLKEYKEV